MKENAPTIEHTLRWHGYADVNIEELLQKLLESGGQEGERKIQNTLKYCCEVARVKE